VGISNNDGTVKLYDVAMRVQSSRRQLVDVGTVRLDVPINHCESFLILSPFFSMFLSRETMCPSCGNGESSLYLSTYNGDLSRAALHFQTLPSFYIFTVHIMGVF